MISVHVRVFYVSIIQTCGRTRSPPFDAPDLPKTDPGRAGVIYTPIPGIFKNSYISKWEQAPSWSPYAYGLANPVRYIDPDGRFPSPYRVAPGSGNHWSDGITNSDWTLHKGSEMYQQAMSAGAVSIGRNQYIHSDGEYKLLSSRNGLLGFWDMRVWLSYDPFASRGVAIDTEETFRLVGNAQQGRSDSSFDFWNTADNIGDGISAFASPWALAGGIAEAEVIGDSYISAAKAYKVAFSKSFQATTQYTKVLGAAGKILGVTGIVTSGMVLWNDPSLTNLTKFGINIGTMFLKANPLGLTVSLGVGLLDYTGYLDKGLNYIYNENTAK